MTGTIQRELPEHAALATFGGGCFWCLEMEFKRVPGVLFVRSGYEGGETENPTYEAVCTGRTGHAEANEIYYDPDAVSYRELLEHFLTRAHDPTQLNGQGVDLGTQYRSVIFYRNAEQKEEAENAIAAVNASDQWKKPIVTALEPHTVFWPAEDYHQNYYERYEAMHGAPHVRAAYKLRKWAAQK